MYENEDRRAAAVNAAAKALGGAGYAVRDNYAVASDALKELTDHIEHFIEHGTWEAGR